MHHDRIPDLFDGCCSDDLQLPNTYTRAIAGRRRVWVIQRIALPCELQDEVEDDRPLAQTSLEFFKEIIRRPCLQFFQRLTRSAGLRFPVIASEWIRPLTVKTVSPSVVLLIPSIWPHLIRLLAPICWAIRVPDVSS